MAERYKREVAYRVFSKDLVKSTVVPRGDGEFDVQYTKLPTGQLINRVFVCGALIDLQDFGSDTPFYKLRISDTKGMFEANIGQYSSEPAQMLAEKIEFPCYVAIVGKVKSREYNDMTYFDISVEYMTQIDEDTYAKWIEETEEYTCARQDEYEDQSV